MPKMAMIRNGPRNRLKIAPGRRMTSMSSLRRTADSRARTLTSGIRASGGCPDGLTRTGLDEGGELVGRGIRRRLPVHELREHLVERGPVFAREHHFGARGAERL